MPFFKFYVVVLFSLFLSACSLTDTTEQNKNKQKNTSDDQTSTEQSIAEISKDIIALVPEQDSSTQPDSIGEKKALSEKNAEVAEAAPSSTLYEQFIQQQQNMQSTLPAPALAEYQQALVQMEQKNWQQAQLLLDNVLKVEPNFSACHVNKALISYHHNNTIQALELLAKAQHINAINPYIYNLKGIMLRETGEFEDAELSYSQAIKIWPEYAQAHLNLAVLLELYRGKFSQAKAHYLVYLSLQPDDKKVQRWLAGLEIKLAAK